ncbi:winged helix-turn-helix domain-containing protein [Bacteroides sp. OttesenSCG-928-D19]|nr:winged helix-turn-helix domain-containing protein [Bacteroides sp. OttesenSCG-928-D19]
MYKAEIGVYASKVWQLLINNARWSYEDLKRRSGLRDKELGAALGWLAHEDKVEFDQKEDELYVYLCVNIYIG